MTLDYAINLVGEAVDEYTSSLYEDEGLMDYADSMASAWECICDLLETKDKNMTL